MKRDQGEDSFLTVEEHESRSLGLCLGSASAPAVGLGDFTELLHICLCLCKAGTVIVPNSLFLY